MENLFNIFRDLIGVFLKIGKHFLKFDFFGLFSYVSEIVTALSLMPLVSSLGSFCTMLMNAAFGVVELMSGSVLSLFCLDVGTGRSFFEQLVPELGELIKFVQILGYLLLFFIYLTNILRIMTSPNPTTETPIQLTITTAITGILIYHGPTLVVYVEKIFALFYDFCLNLLGGGNFRFINFFNALSDQVIESNMFSVETQVAALVTVIFSVVLTFMVFGAYLKFLLEIAQRYVVTTLLILTSPAAIALACARSTRNSFNKWLRMVASQFIVVISQVIFLGAFINAARNFENVVSTAVSGQKGFTIVMWFFIMYAILYVGKKFDSYLAALGLSTIETGQGLLTTLTSDLSTDASMIMMVSRHNVLNTAASKVFGGIAARRRDAQSGQSLRELPKREAATLIAKRLDRSKATGAYSISDVNEAVRTMGSNQTHKGGRALGQCVATAMRGISQKSIANFELSSCSIQNGSIRMNTIPDKSGKQLEVAFVPESMAIEGGLHKAAGRAVTIGKESYIAFPIGDQSLANKFLINNPGAESKLSQSFGKAEVAPIYMESGNRKVKTGAFRAIEPGSVLTIQTGVSNNSITLAEAATSTTPVAETGDITNARTKGREAAAALEGPVSVPETSHASITYPTAQGQNRIEHAPTIPQSGTEHTTSQLRITAEGISVRRDQENTVHNVEFAQSKEIDPSFTTVDTAQAQPFYELNTYSNVEVLAQFSSLSSSTVPGQKQVQTVIVHEWVPKANFEYESILNPKSEAVGTSDYWHYTVPMVYVDGKLSGVCDEPNIPQAQEAQQKWLHTQFPSLSKDGYTVRGEQRGHIVELKKDDELYVMAPIASYQLNISNAEATIISASNGTKYAITLDVPNHNVFRFRNHHSRTFTAEKPKMVKSGLFSNTTNTIVSEAKKKMITARTKSK